MAIRSFIGGYRRRRLRHTREVIVRGSKITSRLRPRGPVRERWEGGGTPLAHDSAPGRVCEYCRRLPRPQE